MSKNLSELFPPGGGVSGGDSAPPVHVGDSPPDDPVEGMQWLNTDDGYLYIYYDNAGDPTWIAIGGSAGEGGGDTGTGDPYWDSVELLVNGDNAPDGSQFIFDHSAKHTMTVAGNASVSTTESKYGSGSLKFNGPNSGYVAVEGVGAKDFYINNADFTVELWANGTSTGTNMFAVSGQPNQTAKSNYFIETVSGKMNVYIGDGTKYTVLTDPDSFSSYSGWVHVAYVNHNGTSSLYMNGVRKDSAPTPNTNNGDSPFFIGGTQDGRYVFNGYIDEVRVSRMARYTGDSFTLPDKHPVGGQRTIVKPFTPQETKEDSNDVDLP